MSGTMAWRTFTRAFVLLIGTFSAATSIVGVALAANEDMPDVVSLRPRGYGWTLTDKNGMTLYTYARDQKDMSACTAACANTSPPFLVSGDAKAGGDWSQITREDGSKQWAFRGKPLYLSARDVKPGDNNGEDYANLWHAAFRPIPMPPGIGFARTVIGYVLADSTEMSLYALDQDHADGSGCNAACLRTWRPVTAPGMAHAIGDWTVIRRLDGVRQWAFRGRPIYRYSGDVLPAEVSGEAKDGHWHAVVLEPPPPTPSWVKIQQSDGGELFADPAGKTLYTFNAPTGNTLTGRPQIPPEWVPVRVSGDVAAVGNWSVIEVDGQEQWAFRGLPLFTSKVDLAPGDISGVRSGDSRFAVIMRVGGTLQGTGQ